MSGAAKSLLDAAYLPGRGKREVTTNTFRAAPSAPSGLEALVATWAKRAEAEYEAGNEAAAIAISGCQHQLEAALRSGGQ